MTGRNPANRPKRAAILCGEYAFRVFLAERVKLGADAVSPDFAAEFVRRTCKVTSRRELATDPDAGELFEALFTDFDAWRGRIGTHR